MKTDLDYICEAALSVAGRYPTTRNEWDHFAAKLLRVLEEKKCQEEYLKKQAEETKKKECEDHPFGVKINGSRSWGGAGDTYCPVRGWVKPEEMWYSGKDALDKLMRGECDQVRLDDVEWINQFDKLAISPQGIMCTPCNHPLSNRLAEAIMQGYFLQNKWLCLKDEK